MKLQYTLERYTLQLKNQSDSVLVFLFYFFTEIRWMRKNIRKTT